MLYCKVELKLSRKFGIGARRQVRRACGVGRDGFISGLREFAQLVKIGTIELEPSEERDETILEGNVVYVVTEKMKTTYFLGFVRAEPRDEGNPAVARRPTHVEKVLGVLQEGADANARGFRKLRAICRLKQQVAVIRVPFGKSGRRLVDGWALRAVVVRSALAGAFATALSSETACIRRKVWVGIGNG